MANVFCSTVKKRVANYREMPNQEGRTIEKNKLKKGDTVRITKNSTQLSTRERWNIEKS